MFGRLLIAVSLLSFAALGFAADNVEIKFDVAGQRSAWIQPGWPNPAPPTDRKSGDASIVLDATSAGPAYLYVWDEVTGNLARRELATSPRVWKPTVKEFQYIAKFTVAVQHKGKPVTGVQVVLNDGARRQEQLLGAADKGEVAFYALKPGMVRVTAEYKTGPEQKALPVVATELKLAREQREPRVTLVIDDPVETAAMPTDPTKADAGSPSAGASPQPTTSSPFVRLLTSLIGIGIVAGLIYAAWRYGTKNQDKVEEKLRSLGVDVPSAPATEDVDGAAPAPPAKPEPLQPIVLPQPEPVAPVAIAAPSVAGPRLIGDSGLILSIADGASVVGRDAGLELSLPAESSVSRRHAELRRAGSQVVLADLGSTNGTFVNGQRLQGEVDLHSGDVVQFGATRFRFEG